MGNVAGRTAYRSPYLPIGDKRHDLAEVVISDLASADAENLFALQLVAVERCDAHVFSIEAKQNSLPEFLDFKLLENMMLVVDDKSGFFWGPIHSGSEKKVVLLLVMLNSECLGRQFTCVPVC